LYTARFEASEGSIIDNHGKLVDYLRLRMAHRNTEELRILFLNARNELLVDEMANAGTVRQVHAYPREIVKRALEIDATALVLVHNHPSGDVTPSDSDRRLTELIGRAAALFDIVIHDHLVVSRSGWSSFRALGLLTT
jgi:DNA repair protein RadC